MAIPSYDSLIAILKEDYVSPADFLADLSAQMADPDVVRAGHRFKSGVHTFVFHVAGQAAIADVTKDLADAGWEIKDISYLAGYMPPNYMIDYQNAFSGTPDVKGYPSFKWSVIELTKAPEEDAEA